MPNTLPDRENLTINLAPYRLRLNEEQLRTTTYGPSPAAETLIIDQRDGSLYRYPAPVFTPMGHGPDAWVFDITGELQEPPTGNPPPVPPLPPTPTSERPHGYRGDRRRPLPRWVGYVIAVGASAPFWALVTIAGLAAFR